MPTSDDTGFGERLIKLREQAGLTQAQAGAAAKVDAGTISRWERGVGHPRAKELVALAKLFKVSIDHLLLGEPHEDRQQSPEFHRFLGTEWGRKAQDRGWLANILSFRFPTPPTEKNYRDLVMLLLRIEEDQKRDE